MKYKFNIKNLDCANCARKIEEALNNDKNITKAVVNFANLKLTIETPLETNVLKYVQKIVKNIESDVIIYENEVKQEDIYDNIIILLLGIFLGLAGFILKVNDTLKEILIVFSYIILLFKTFLKALKMLIKNKTLNENFLITISCVGAYLINEKIEGLMVIILYSIGKILEAKAVNNSRKAISELMNIKPEYANKKMGKKFIKTNPEDIKVDDIIIVKPGEKIPLDGTVIKGSSSLNTSALTGESTLLKVMKGDNVLSGMINEDGIIEIKVTSSYEDSAVSKILELVENATDKKAKQENFVSKMSKIYTPTVFILAILFVLFGSLFTNIEFDNLLYRALTFLVISCPCAIAISVPLSYFASIGKASKEGILIKGSTYLDELKNVDRIIFDKTGTITTGKFEHAELIVLDKKYSKDELTKIVVNGEKLSNHPIAKSIINLLDTCENIEIKDFKEHKGEGISFTYNGKKIKLGNYKFCQFKDENALIYININDKTVGKINITDKIKESAKPTINSLKNKGIICEIFTGDSKTKSLETAKNLDIDVSYELLPNDKYNLLEKYINKKEVVAFVGDGINDAPTLALANIGISMGGIGSTSAIEASDIVIMNDDLLKINGVIDLSHFTNRIIKQNLIFAISTKVIVLILSAFNIVPMWLAVFADVGVTLLTILNTLRILKFKKM